MHLARMCYSSTACMVEKLEMSCLCSEAQEVREAKVISMRKTAREEVPETNGHTDEDIFEIDVVMVVRCRSRTRMM
jgi:hypothetical protein